MPKQPYRTAPIATEKLPPGIGYIIGNEAAERFSFYGMRTILVVFMTKFLLDASGKSAVMSEEDAKSYFHLFVASAYFFPVIGAILADVWLGKYMTILSLSLFYCFGHAALAADQTRLGLFAGLALIAIGAGGIKPCVSANVGDQFGKANSHYLERVYGWFYLSINFGSFFSTILTPWLLEDLAAWLITTFQVQSPAAVDRLKHIGPHVAFGVPGILMLLATIVFWMGRYHYAHVPARGVENVFGALRGDGWKCLVKLIPFYVFAAIFWSLYDQTGSAWVLQAEKMDRNWLGIEWRASQIQAINPLLILILIPIFSFGIYPAINSVFRLTPMRKISIGLFLTVVAFAISSMAQKRIDDGQTPSVVWQLVAYVVITMAEVMVSVTGLEFSYTQAPREMKSFVMSMWMLTVTFGNLFTTLVNKLIQKPLPNGKVEVILKGADYYWFFTGLMLVAAVVFIVVAYFYKEQTFIQEEQPNT
ncbi:MAG: POT family MFS transporter [Planctomycetia bacterium]|nr:POT family MFS transporter [Planctomycetia bacterium]